MQSLTTYINQPELLTTEVVDELAEMVEHNPSFQAARILLVQGLYRLQDPRFGEELRKAALFIPNRTTLFRMLEEEKMKPEVVVRPAAVVKPLKPASDRTQSLIESFLEQQPDAATLSRKTHPVDASVDYMSYLMQQADALPEGLPDAEPEEEEVNDDDELYDDDDEVMLDMETPSQPQNVTNDPYFTETLAQIYIKQGKYNKAIEIIRRLSLNVPEKNRYFADQIRFLEKLILNERTSDNENQQK